MAFDVTALAEYSKEREMALLLRSFFEGQSMSLLKSKGNILDGVKHKHKLPSAVDTEATWQDGSDCGFTPSGTTTITKRELEVGVIKIQEEYCPRDLRQKFEAYALQAGSFQEKMPFEQEISEAKANTIAEQMEVSVWQSDTAAVGADPHLDKFDGILKNIGNDGITLTDAPAAIATGDDVYDLVEAVVLEAPAKLFKKPDFELLLPESWWRKLLAYLTRNNLFHYTTDEASRENAFKFPGAQLMVRGLVGLDGTDTAVAARWSNFWAGMDLKDEDKRFRWTYNEHDEMMRFNCRFKLGTQVSFPEETIIYTPE